MVVFGFSNTMLSDDVCLADDDTDNDDDGGGIMVNADVVALTASAATTVDAKNFIFFLFPLFLISFTGGERMDEYVVWICLDLK